MKKSLFSLLLIVLFAGCQNTIVENQNELGQTESSIDALLDNFYDILLEPKDQLLSDNELELIQGNIDIILKKKQEIGDNEFHKLLEKVVSTNSFNSDLKESPNLSTAQCTNIYCGPGCYSTVTGKGKCRQQASYQLIYSLLYCFGNSQPLNCIVIMFTTAIEEFDRINSCGPDVECCPFPCV